MTGPPAAAVEQRETPDAASSSARYARRFSGSVGRWFLQVQERAALELLAVLPPGGRVLDVGGGHAQVSPALWRAGYRVTVIGSPEADRELLRPWLGPARVSYAAGDLARLPFGDAAFDAVVCLRILPHMRAWRRLVAELCRVARRHVLVDYPAARGVNLLSERLFALKRRVETDTRRFRLFRREELEEPFGASGFGPGGETGQFLLPMALHRLLGVAAVSRLLEAPGRIVGLTRAAGSPVVARWDRS